MFYALEQRYPTPTLQADGTETTANENHAVYLHVLGTSQSEDILCYSTPEHPKWNCGAEVTNDGRYVIFSSRDGCRPCNSLTIADLSKLPNLEPQTWVADVALASFDYKAEAEDGGLLFVTNWEAPRNRIIKGVYDVSESAVRVHQTRRLRACCLFTVTIGAMDDGRAGISVCSRASGSDGQVVVGAALRGLHLQQALHREHQGRACGARGRRSR